MKARRHKTIECGNGECRTRINPSNSAINFKNPALSVKIAVESGIIREGKTILEVGPGNLRNALFILNSVPNVTFSVYDLQDTIRRFIENYERFKELGGSIVNADYGQGNYDIILCTFVLETICPIQKRGFILQSIGEALGAQGALIASFRGYPGVIGSRYKKCPMGEGLITPLNTFVKPYSIPEVESLLSSCGFNFFRTLQTYRVKKPQNIHIMASMEA